MAILKVGTSPSNLVDVPDPSTMSYGLQDVSASDAGRVQDGDARMYKNRVTQKVKLALSWNVPDRDQAHAILQAFNPEYFYVRYWDPLMGADTTREFYAGDRSAPLKMWTVDKKVYTSLSFDIIER